MQYNSTISPSASMPMKLITTLFCLTLMNGQCNDEDLDDVWSEKTTTVTVKDVNKFIKDIEEGDIDCIIVFPVKSLGDLRSSKNASVIVNKKKIDELFKNFKVKATNPRLDPKKTERFILTPICKKKPSYKRSFALIRTGKSLYFQLIGDKFELDKKTTQNLNALLNTPAP